MKKATVYKFIEIAVYVLLFASAIVLEFLIADKPWLFPKWLSDGSISVGMFVTLPLWIVFVIIYIVRKIKNRKK